MTGSEGMEIEQGFSRLRHAWFSSNSVAGDESIVPGSAVPSSFFCLFVFFFTHPISLSHAVRIVQFVCGK